ncbi:G-protein coupled receptor 179 precursor [Mus musculus]|uniref:G-protein coupled receptor 179 n=1 Tax=Mus musculus TaxID=10090 RepID=GP179_MOUSE|nr:G-protein coupled receptor 179 precursor [Mus musculus]E9PY61.1 RecName: Full=G-protein coupled receptor 179; Flags: Precursor [Mus musculus]|eukprot:NP_001074689.1 probable G-protein coupled receptor 179 precursor [Mus musculus]
MGARAVVISSLAWGLLSCCFLCSGALGSQRPLRSLPPLPSQAKPRSEPMWMPPKGAEAALAFLYSGDVQRLSGANCSEKYEVRGAEGKAGVPPVLQRAAGTLAQAANFLNMLLQANDIRESSVEEDVEWYQALVRSVAEGDPKAYRALLTFNPAPGASHLQLALQATRMGDETVLQDLSGNKVQEETPGEDLDRPVLQKRVLTNDLRSLDSPKWPRGDGYVGDIQQVKLSPPFLECHEGQLRPGWLVTVSATFYGLKPDLTPEVRGQVQMDIDLQSVDINQCASGPGWYSNTHLCDLNSTQCVPLESQGFVLGRYLCRCRPGFYGASGSGGLEESATQAAGQFGSPQDSLGKLLRCQPCPEGCTSCLDATPCLVEEALALRTAVLACQACCMLAVFLSMLVAYRCRGSKRIRASGIVLLETILFGSLLLYFPVFILYFKPSVFRCVALRWVRLLGFAVVYGTIILKLYRVLQLFLSRTAQRVPHPSSGQLLRRLGQLLLLVLGFLVVWTAGALEPGTQHTALVTRGHTPTGRHFYLCHHDHWDYIMVVAEMLLLCWGSFLCYATRAVPSAFHEPRYMSIALHNELLLSTAFHTARFVLVPSLHPDWTLLLFFLHTHSTVTATLALIFIPKFWKPGAPPREEILDEVYEDELDLQRSGSYLNSSIASAWSERSLEPGDIRDELKKLYAQLEIRKTKEMAANNPHLPKKRGSSHQGLGRSFMRYLAEFPEALARQHSRDSGSLGLGSLPGSSRRRLLSSSLQETEKPPALRKTRSTYDHHREHNTLPFDSTLRRTLSKKASPTDGRESLADGPPALGFRSASAHNLTVGERLPRARPISLQKSLSVAAGSREKALLVASQAYLEETYRQAKEREERKKAEAAMVSPVRRPSTRRLEWPLRAPLSAPPSPGKSSSMDSSQTTARPHEEAGRRLPHPPIRHQVSTPVLALSGICLGEPRMLSPTPASTLAPILLPAPAPAPAPVLAPVSKPPQSPTLLTFICPWENAELPGKKENVVQEDPAGPERSGHSPASARTKIWRALSVAVEKRGTGESEALTEGGHVQGEADDTDEEKPKVFSKSHSLKTPLQQGSVRSLGLAIKALTRSRSTYKEKDGGEGTPETEKGKPTEVSTGAPLRSPRLGRPKAVSKQVALAPCEDEESLQNQQNAHTSRMLHVCQKEGSREQEDRNKRVAPGPGERKVERTGKITMTTLRQVFGEKNAEQAKESPAGYQEVPNPALQSLGSADHRVAEVCPWEVTEPESGMDPPESVNKAKVYSWERTEGGSLEKKPSRQVLSRSWEEREKVLAESETEGVGAIPRKKPERLVRSQEAVCPWESPDSGGLSPQLVHQESDRTGGRFVVVSKGDAHPEALPSHAAKAELCLWEMSDVGEGTSTQRVQELPEERQKSPKKATFWGERNLGGDLVSLCPWESTDFRGPSAVSLQAPGSSGSLGSGIAEVCPWEAENIANDKKAEVCPWELGEELAGSDGLNPGADGKSLPGKETPSRKGCLAESGEQTVRAKPTVPQGQESVCPWEDEAPERSSPQPDKASSKAGEKLLSHGGSQVLQVCPWEAVKPEEKQATLSTAEICPWEVDGQPETRTSEHPSKGEVHKDEEKMPGRARIKAQEEAEGRIQKQEAICPWESMAPGSTPQRDTEKAQASLQRQGSVAGRAAEICPWEVGTEVGEERTIGAEASEARPNDAGHASTDSGSRQVAASAPKKSERLGSEKEVVCPWDSLSPGDSSQQPDTPNTEKLKDELQEHGSSRPIEVCPWEAEEVPTGEKAKICPWELNEGTVGKGLEREPGCEPERQRRQNLEEAGLPFQEEGTSKGDTKLCREQEGEAICPWKPPAQVPKVSDLPLSTVGQGVEGQSLEASDRASEKGELRQDLKMGSLPEYITQVVPVDGGGASSELQPISLQEGMVLAGSSSHPHIQCPDQPRVSSQPLVSTGDGTAEVCPWDAPDSDSDTKVEPCAQKVTGRVTETEMSRQDEKEKSQEEKERAPETRDHEGVAVQKMPQTSNFGKQEAVCPRESQDFGVQAATDASDGSKGGSEKVCPWEVEEVPSIKEAEICPWEASPGAVGEGALDLGQDGESQGEGRAERHLLKAAETVCPLEGTMSSGLFTQEDVVDTDLPKVGLHGASSPGKGLAELCVWEVTDPEGNKIKGTMADICPWEETRAQSDESGPLALPVTQAGVPAAPEKSVCLSVHGPLESFLPESKSVRPDISKPPGSSRPEGVREQEPLELETGAKSVPKPSPTETEAPESFTLTDDQGLMASEGEAGELSPPPDYPWDCE